MILMTSEAFSSRSNVEDDPAGLVGIGGPMNRASGRGAAGFKLFEISAQVFQNMGANSRRGRSQLLPVGLLRHQLAALGLNHVDGVGHVLSQLRIAQHRQRRLRKRRRVRRVEHGMVSRVAHPSASAGTASVLARISAR